MAKKKIHPLILILIVIIGINMMKIMGLLLITLYYIFNDLNVIG